MRTVILGKGGHAKVVGAALQSWGDPELCLIFVDEGEEAPQGLLVNGVGDRIKRRELYDALVWGHKWVPMVRHRSAIYHPSEENGLAVQIMAGAIVQPGCHLGHNVLINTGAQVDHDCRINAHSIISPGAILCGGVTLGVGCFVGAGATILEGITLEPDTFVPAGTLVAGSGDFRKPVRMVRHDGADYASITKASIPLDGCYQPVGYRHYPNPQSP